MAPITLTLACGLYDRMLPLYTGDVRAKGIDLNFIQMDGSKGAREIFDRMNGGLEFDVAEMSCSEFVSLVAAGDSPLVGIAVFPSRVFRHGMVTINRSSGISKPKDLEGKKVGLPLYTMSAAIWIRGHLEEDFGVDLSTIEWVQGAVNAPGSHGQPSAPPMLGKVNLRDNHSGKSLSDMLECGELDAIVGTVLPKAYFNNPDIVRLFPDYREVERALFVKKRLFPIMHMIAIRKDVYQRYPFIATSLYDAMCEAKESARLRMRDLGTLQYMLPWMTADFDEIDEVFGGDAFPYGIEPNRPTLETFVRFLRSQGLISEEMPIEDLFVPVHGAYSGKTGQPSSIK